MQSEGRGELARSANREIGGPGRRSRLWVVVRDRNTNLVLEERESRVGLIGESLRSPALRDDLSYRGEHSKLCDEFFRMAN